MIAPTKEEQEILRQYAAPRWVWNVFAAIVGLIIVTEVPIVLFFASPELVMRIQTGNGALVVAGGFLWAVVAFIVVMQPIKRMTVRMLVENLSMEKRLSATMAKVDRVTETVQKDLDNGIIARLEEHIEAIRKKIDKEAPEPLRIKRRENREQIPPSAVGVPSGQDLGGPQGPVPEENSDPSLP
jgi:hypothetical protein